MAYKNNWATGDLIDATAFQELVNSAVYSFASLSAIQSGISSAVDGQIAFAQDTETYYRYDADSTSWMLFYQLLTYNSCDNHNSIWIWSFWWSFCNFWRLHSFTQTSLTSMVNLVTATVSDEMLIADVSGIKCNKEDHFEWIFQCH